MNDALKWRRAAHKYYVPEDKFRLDAADVLPGTCRYHHCSGHKFTLTGGKQTNSQQS